MQHPKEADDEGKPLLQIDEVRELIGSLTVALSDIEKLKGKVKVLEGTLATNESGAVTANLSDKLHSAVSNAMNCTALTYLPSPATADDMIPASKEDGQPSMHDQLASAQISNSPNSLRGEPRSLLVGYDNNDAQNMPQSMIKADSFVKYKNKPTFSSDIGADAKEAEEQKSNKSFKTAAVKVMQAGKSEKFKLALQPGKSEKFKPTSILNKSGSRSTRTIPIGEGNGDDESENKVSRWDKVRNPNGSFRQVVKAVHAFKKKVSFAGGADVNDCEDFLPDFKEDRRDDDDDDDDHDKNRNFGRLAVLGGGDEQQLEEDAYTLLMLSGFCSKSGALGLGSFTFQMLLGSFVAYDQIKASRGSSTFNIPFRVSPVVRLGQFCCIILALCTQSDILTSVRALVVMGRDSNWDFIVGKEGEKTRRNWIIRIALPNLMKFTQGILVAFVSFIVVVQTANIIELLQNFSALMVISETDNVLFHLAQYGYLGEELREETHRLDDLSVVNLSMSFAARKTSKGIKFVRLIFAIMTLLFLGGWGYILYFQQQGFYFEKKFPDCGKERKNTKEMYLLAKKHFGDGKCYGGELNTLECKFEDGDCISFNFAYPECKGKGLTYLTDVQNQLAKETCDDKAFAIPECKFSAGSCCSYDIQDSPTFGDGICNGGTPSTELCGFDKKDCYPFSQNFPRCPLEELAEISGSSDVILGNGICESSIYASPECGYENRDCDVGQIGQDIILKGVASGTAVFFKMRISADGSKVIIGNFRSSENFEYDDTDSPGRVSVYTFDSTSLMWNRDASLVGDEVADRFGFGLFTNIDGERVVVGASRHDDNGGIAKVYQFNSTLQTWGQLGLEINSFGAYTGISVAMTDSGSRIAVAASAASTNGFTLNGAVKVYDLSDDNIWEQVGNDIVGETYNAFGFFHMQLNSADGSRVFVSSGYETFPNFVSLVAFEFDYALYEWIQLGQRVANPYPTRGNPAVSADGSRFAISSYAVKEDQPGEVDIYELSVIENVKEWKRMGNTLTAQNPKDGDGFGSSLSLTADGSLLAISAVSQDCNGNPRFCETGVVNLYKYKPTNIPDVPFMRVPLKKAPGYGHVAQEEERNTDKDLVGRDVLLSRDGSKIFISGFDIVNGNGFVKAYNVDDIFYPECTLSKPEQIGDTKCMVWEPNYTPECGYDGGDCPSPKPVENFPECRVSNPGYLEDGKCIDVYPYNSEACGYDNGACPLPSPVEGYPNCFVSDPEEIGNESCNDWHPYNTIDCGFDGGDCLP